MGYIAGESFETVFNAWDEKVNIEGYPRGSSP